MEAIKITAEEFVETPQGRWFHDLFDVKETVGPAVLAFFSDAGRQGRMEDSELHHDRPPLAAVVCELEWLPCVDEWIRAYTVVQRAWRTGRKPVHLSHFFGAVTRQVMEGRGWKPAGRKGSLAGVGAVLLRKAERFIPPSDHPHFDLWAERHPTWSLRPEPPSRPLQAPNRPGPTEGATEGRTRAQEMRDLIAGREPGTLVLRLGVSRDTLRNWLKQARRDDGEEVTGRGTQPPITTLEVIRRMLS